MKLAKKGTFDIDKFIPIVFGILLFTALIGSVASQIVLATNPFNSSTNLSSGAIVLLGLTTLILIIGFVMSIYKYRG